MMVFRRTVVEDIAGISELAYDAFMGGYYTGVAENDLRTGTYNYVISELSDSTFSEVYEEDGKILGFVMGRANGKPKMFSDLKKYRKSGGSKFFNKVGDLIDECNHRILSVYPEELDCEGLLFAVDAKCRGKGVGTRLFNDMMDDFRKNGCRHMYLFTGDNCTMGYYDHNGYEMAGKEILDLGFRSRDSRMYCKKL